MGLFNTVLINGKKISVAKFDNMVEKATNNIILAGFTEEEALYRHIINNCGNSNYMSVKVLMRMIAIYNNRMEEESESLFSSLSSCYNIIDISEKIKIIYNVLTSFTSIEMERIKTEIVAAKDKEEEKRKITIPEFKRDPEEEEIYQLACRAEEAAEYELTEEEEKKLKEE